MSHCSGQRPCLAGPFTAARLDTESPNVRKTYTGGDMLEDRGKPGVSTIFAKPDLRLKSPPV